MGNEKQVNKSLIERSKSEFLPAEFLDPDSRVVSYSLEEEYAKTQQNRSIRLYLAIIVFFAAIVTASVIWVVILQKQGENLEVDISDFKDIKALDVINQIKGLETRLNKLRFELEELVMKQNDELSRLNRELRSQREALLSVEEEKSPTESIEPTEESIFDDTVSESPAETTESTEMTEVAEPEPTTSGDGESVAAKDDLVAVDSRFRGRSSSIRNSYSSRIEAKEREIKLVEQELEELKKRTGSDVETAGAVLGEKDELYSLQMNKVRMEYEERIEEINRKHQEELDELLMRYNPIFREKKLQAIIARRIIKSRLPSELLAGIEKDLIQERVVTMNQINEIRRGVSGEIGLLNRLQSVPYSNSVPRSLLHIESFSKRSIQSYDKIIAEMVSRVRRKNAMISAYNYAFVSKTKRDGENGFVLDGRNRDRIILYIDDIYEIRDGDTAFVFRSDESQIATISIQKGSDLHYGRVVTATAGVSIRSFDKIMLKVIRERE
jgi:hypothetical protein